MNKLIEKKHFLLIVCFLLIIGVVILNVMTNSMSSIDEQSVAMTVDIHTDEQTENEEIIELREELEALQEEKPENQEVLKEIEQFLSEYGNSFSLRLQTLTPDKAQELVYAQMHPYYTEDAWLDTHYYQDICSEDTQLYLSTGNFFMNDYRDMVHFYYRYLTDNSAEVFIIINNQSDDCTDYEFVTVEKFDGEWKISEYYRKQVM